MCSSTHKVSHYRLRSCSRDCSSELPSRTCATSTDLKIIKNRANSLRLLQLLGPPILDAKGMLAASVYPYCDRCVEYDLRDASCLG